MSRATNNTRSARWFGSIGHARTPWGRGSSSPHLDSTRSAAIYSRSAIAVRIRGSPPRHHEHHESDTHMKRLKTQGNAGDDLHGVGKNGFTDGNALIAAPPSQLNSNWFNETQENLARACEDDGQTVENAPSLADPSPAYHGLGDAIGHGSDAMFPRTEDARFVVEGLTIDAPFGGLDAVLRPGRYVFDGRRYYATAAKMMAAYPDSNFMVELEFGGTPTDGDYITTFDGFGLASPVPVITTRTAGSPATNGGLAAQHDADIAAEGALAIDPVVGDHDVAATVVELLIGGGLPAGTITTEAPAGASLEASHAGLHLGTLAANSDNYVFIAPEDPDDPSDPPDRSGFYFEIEAVGNGASAPSTPDGTMLIAMVATGASSIDSIIYFCRGPAIVAENGAGLRLQPGDTPLLASAALVPVSADKVDLGEETPRGQEAPTQSGYLGAVHCEEIRLRSETAPIAGDQTHIYASRFTRARSVASNGTTAISIASALEWPDGSCLTVEAKGAAIDPSDPTDAYSFAIVCHAHLDGGSWELDGSGGTPWFADGNGGIAAGMTVNFEVEGNDLRLLLTGHSTDTTRWHVLFDVIGTGAA